MKATHVLLALLLVGGACSSGGPGKPPPGGGGGNGGSGGGPPPRTNDPPPAPFEPLAAPAYVAKVKGLLTGLYATDDEVNAVVADPRALRGLVDRWATTPEFRARMLVFFQQAFQQT